MPASSADASFAVGAVRKLPTATTDFGISLNRARILSRAVSFDPVSRRVSVEAVTNIACGLLMLVSQQGMPLARAETGPGTSHTAQIPVPAGVKGQITVELEVSQLA